MTTRILKGQVVRIVAIVAVVTALLASGGAAGATPAEVGLTACEDEGCSIVTLHDLAVSRDATGNPSQNASQPAGVGFTE